MNLKKTDWQILSARRVHAFEKIAKALGKNHPITKLMGSLAWGRHGAENSAQNLQGVCHEVGFLDGFFDCLNQWARDNDRAAQRVMNEHYPHGFCVETKPSNHA